VPNSRGISKKQCISRLICHPEHQLDRKHRGCQQHCSLRRAMATSRTQIPCTKRNFELTDARVGSVPSATHHKYCARKRSEVSGNLVDSWEVAAKTCELASSDWLYSLGMRCSSRRQPAYTKAVVVQVDSELPRSCEMLAPSSHVCVGVSPAAGDEWIVVCLGLGVEFGNVRPKPGCADLAG
jgi:hypothetical protein